MSDNGHDVPSIEDFTGRRVSGLTKWIRTLTRDDVLWVMRLPDEAVTP